MAARSYDTASRPKKYRALDYPDRSRTLSRAQNYPAEPDYYGPQYYAKEPPKDKETCRQFSKYAIYGCNILFVLVGTATLALGVWLRTDSRFREFLSERYKQVVNEAFWEAPTLFTFSYLLIVLGAVMGVVAMIGCCGVSIGSRLFLGFYAVALFILLVFTASCGIYIIYRHNGIDVELSDALNYMVQHYYQGPSIVQEALDRLQQAFRCCGNAGCSDFRMFRQDPPRTCDIRCDGCHYRIILALRIGFSVAIVVFAICMIAEVVAIVIALVLAFRDDKRYKFLTKQRPIYLYPSREEYERQRVINRSFKNNRPKSRPQYY